MTLNLKIIPDRQVVYLLDYLRRSLLGDKYIPQWFDTADQCVAWTLARPFKLEITYKGEPMFNMDRANLPCLALWREGNNPQQAYAGVSRNDAEFGFGWIFELPAAGENVDSEELGNTIANNVWDRCWRYLDAMPLADRTKAGVGSVIVGDCALLPPSAENFCGFVSALTVQHTQPPYTVEDPEDFVKALLSLKLYDSATIGGDGIQGLYQGLTLEAEAEP